MAVCPFAQQDPLEKDGHTMNGGTYTGGPFKIVHHTTEGPTYGGARSTYLDTTNFPHFTVDDTHIYQHLDTSRSATALRNKDGGVQTNRDSAIQMEVVGFASKPKSPATLANIAKLCRWIEQTHQVAKEWPNGFPSVINRDAVTWDTRSGHYGHCHVPENDHEDPGYTLEEVMVIMRHGKVSVSVAGNSLPNAIAFLDGDTLWGSVRNIVQAMGGTVIPAGDGVTVRIELKGKVIDAKSRGSSTGMSFIPLRELRRFAGVLVDFHNGASPSVSISLP